MKKIAEKGPAYRPILSAKRLSLLLGLLLVCLGQPFLAFAQSPAVVDRLTQQWLDIERQSTHLEAQWKAQKPLLDQRLALLNAEKKQLTALLEHSHSSKDEVDVRRTELLAEQSTLEQQQARLAQSLNLLQSRVDSMGPQLPPALTATWSAEQAALNEDAETSQRLQVALAKLGHLADFDQRISVHESTISGISDSPVLVKQLYLGLGMAWFVSRDGALAGWGQSSEDGWHWHIGGVDADAIHSAIAMFEKRKPADLVRLPVRRSDFKHSHSEQHSGMAK